MDTLDIANNIINSQAASDVFLIVGDCSISYEGRGWTNTDGRHLVLINPDQSVIVHSPNSVQPKNWQPSGSNIDVDIDDDDQLFVEATRTNPDERLAIRFSNILHTFRFNPTDEELDLIGSEKEIHKHLYSNPDIIHDDFTPQQLEKEVDAGYIDIFGDINETPTIIEVKRRKAQVDHVGQLDRYVNAYDAEQINGYLVAPDITDSAQSLLEEHGYMFVQFKPQQLPHVP